MGYRVASYDAGMSVLWALLGLLQITTINRRYPVGLPLATGTIGLGIIVGAVIGFVGSRRMLRFLERKGESRASLSTLLIVIGVVFIFASAFYFVALSVPLEWWTIFFNALFPLPSVGFAIQAVMFRNWEKKHRRVILAALFGGLYVYPKLEQPL